MAFVAYATSPLLSFSPGSTQPRNNGEETKEERERKKREKVESGVALSADWTPRCIGIDVLLIRETLSIRKCVIRALVALENPSIVDQRA